MTLLRMLAFRPAEAGGQAANAPTARAVPSPQTAPRMAAPPMVAEAHAASYDVAAARERDQTAQRTTAEIAEATLRAPSAKDDKSSSAAPEMPSRLPRAPMDTNDWAGLIETAGLRGPVGALAQHCTLIAIEQHAVRLSLKPEHEHFSAPPLVVAMEEKLGQALGRAVKVRFEKNAGAQQVETPAEAAGRVRDARQQAAERALNDDPIVQALMRDFDARLIPESVKPVT